METVNKADKAALLLDEIKLKIKENEIISAYSDLLDDHLLLGFLNGKKLRLDETVKCLEHFIKMRTGKYKQFTKKFRPSTATMVDKGIVNILKEKDPKGRVVVLFQASPWIPSEASLEDCIATAMFFMDEAIRSVFSEGNELVCIVDCKGFGFNQGRHFTPRIILLAVELFMRSCPSRPKAFHIVNEGYVINGLLRLLRTQLDKKLQDRFHFHSSDYEGLHEHVPASLLPASLGGEVLSLEEACDEVIIPRILQRDDFYKKLARKVSLS
ncbi:alpha-tocopherol transfer protein-like [Folsomia candida]|uniref:alpha-tocopherol transfer protein-like n=1 Tax=Folsomia candida TaxID=158441 RepID=UPI000B8F09BF|nr:alpha-tocopherol transfer protein-like [Folsomia candida]